MLCARWHSWMATLCESQRKWSTLTEGETHSGYAKIYERNWRAAAACRGTNMPAMTESLAKLNFTKVAIGCS